MLLKDEVLGSKSAKRANNLLEESFELTSEGLGLMSYRTSLGSTGRCYNLFLQVILPCHRMRLVSQ